MAYSREQLVLLALDWRGIPGSGQTANAEDVAKVNDVLPGVMDSLARRDIYVWGDPDNVEDAAAIPISMILAWHVPDLGVMSTGCPSMKEAEQQLRELRPLIISGSTMAVDYF